jgi:hypothetical protein
MCNAIETLIQTHIFCGQSQYSTMYACTTQGSCIKVGQNRSSNSRSVARNSEVPFDFDGFAI